MASRHRFELNGEIRTVAVDEVDGAIAVAVDGGEPIIVDATTSGIPGHVSMIVDGRPSKAFVRRAGGDYIVTVGGRTVTLRTAMGSGKGRAAGAASDPPGTITAPSGGTVVDVRVSPGDHIDAGDTVAVIEAMKMQSEIQTPLAGTVTAVSCEAGTRAEQGAVLVEYDVDEE
jgi:biotin carboxyl carrier protein